MENKFLRVLLFFILFFLLSSIIIVVFVYDTHKQQAHISIFSSPTMPQSLPTSIPNAIIFPNGGETLINGNSYTLQWRGGDKIITIFLINNDLASQGNSVGIVDRIINITNTGSYQYTIPQSIKSGNYRFQIGDINSNVFTIASNQATTAPCISTNIDPELTFEGAAGTIYGTLRLMNISKAPCVLKGSNFPTIHYSSLISNVKVSYSETVVNKSYVLAPQQAIYALVHYPNGPQCQSPIKQFSATFNYQVSQGVLLQFHGTNGQESFSITACSDSSNITNIEFKPFSNVKPGA